MDLCNRLQFRWNSEDRSMNLAHPPMNGESGALMHEWKASLNKQTGSSIWFMEDASKPMIPKSMKKTV